MANEQLISKKTTITLGLALTILILLLASAVSWGASAQKIENHELRLNKVENKIDNLATKEDLNTLKGDLIRELSK